ncbi:MAG: hypothetical protein KGQ38_02560 [Actinomycetales bacterium]|nr:hypothetical protein [Actinomycetales bacterium]
MPLNLEHLISLSDGVGIFEHAKYFTPRLDHGYCVDDVARALILIERNQPDHDAAMDLRKTYFQFLRQAQSSDGAFINRLDVAGRWTGEPEVSDHWGRALWALGTTFNRESDRDIAYEALQRFELGAQNRSAYLRSMMFAALGSAQVLEIDSQNQPALALLKITANRIMNMAENVPADQKWIWPERRLTYANAVLPEVLLLAGYYLNEPEYIATGIRLLQWLLAQESTLTHLSVTPVAGYGIGEQRQIYDQQPIEVAALVDAGVTAYNLTGDPTWLEVVARGNAWFHGVNDSGVLMHEPDIGAGFDGLTKSGRNENSGAESTIAYLSTVDQFERYQEDCAYVS